MPKTLKTNVCLNAKKLKTDKIERKY